MNIEHHIRDRLARALVSLVDAASDIEIEVPNDKQNGDYSTNIAMKLAKTLKKPPRAIAEMIVAAFGEDDHLTDITIAGPGFINFFVDKTVYTHLIPIINRTQNRYGNLDIGTGEHVNIEFVSANPTGSLHIGHARGAAAGDALGRILTKAGYQVTREFYVNDAGNQITNLVCSIEARYRQAFGEDAPMPSDGYHGKEIIDLAEALKVAHGDRFLHEPSDKFFRAFGVEHLLNHLRKDLEIFRVEFDVWFSETSLYETNAVENTLDFLKQEGFTYEQDGAIWLKTSLYGDEKDRVIIKSDGTYTYIVPDIAYHKDKLSRGFTKLIDILGGDHHGYVPRLKAAIQMIGGRDDLLEVDLLQMVKILQNGEELKMSKRSGKAITLRDLIEEVGTDPIRYFFAMRSLNTHMELDLDLALKETNENPVFYAQYAHARIASILRMAEERGIAIDVALETFTTLKSDKALDLLAVVADYPKAVEEAARKRLPHKITQYIQRLAQSLHSFYAAEIVLSDDAVATHERLVMLSAVKLVLCDALDLVGVEAKERM